ncbi:hypothetical protein [Pectobacterium parmentieri]|nr:hypothetical protein [Pectobacterium parmentieri]AYH04255.1 hypothetical protein C5E25_01940 [Pectobacterium parmentieri]AYH04261.1 hypothetical protein C5E25_01980 [Pectobacterium parmentieri]AYH13076.1 hypothetical protein C5E23_01925 [Pectobacterium parmentieri]AYH13082.1 hypothetical protein C5E23_01965 [Pectobacterium parmentieri]AYH21778.1 hypothetical protein C5E21_01920 [Pectobacterium parmentieri]
MIDFSYLSDNDGSKPSLILHDKAIKKLETYFLLLKEKTGIYIDPYGKTRVYPDHQKILINFLVNIKDEEVINFVEFLTKAINENEVIIAEGD